jgi:hypothetical protein
MKRLFPIALMLCLFVSLSSFAPMHPKATVVKKGAMRYTFPLSGSTFGKGGATIYYTVNGSGTIPSSISFNTTSGGGNNLGTYSFSLSSPGNYLATGMKTTTSITATYFHVSNACGSDYCMEFIGGD